MTQVRFFAAAAEAMGTDATPTQAATLGELRAELTAASPRLAALLDRCALLVDGARVSDDEAIGDAVNVDVLPPFAGG